MIPRRGKVSPLAAVDWAVAVPLPADPLDVEDELVEEVPVLLVVLPDVLVPPVVVVPPVVLVLPDVLVPPVVVVPPDALVPPLVVVVSPVVEVLLAEELLALVLVLVLAELVVDAALVLVAVSAAAASVEELDPDSPPPQPASAIDTLLNSAGQITRPDPNPRLAFLMRSPKKRLHCRPGRTKSFIQRRCTRGHGNAWVAGGFSRGSASAPATPLS